MQWAVRQMLCFYHIDNLSEHETFDVDELDRILELLNVAPTEAEGKEIPLLTRSRHWWNKARALRFAYQAKPEDSSLINKAIECAETSSSLIRRARGKISVSDEILAISLTAQARILVIRFRTSEASDDLRHIIRLYQEALSMCRSQSRPQTHTHQALAWCQLMWHERKGAFETSGAVRVDAFLIDAFHNAKAAYRIFCKYADTYELYVHILVEAWIRCFEIFEDWSFLDEAIQIVEDSLIKISHRENPHKIHACTNFEVTKCCLLFRRYLVRRCPRFYDEVMNAVHQHCLSNRLQAIDGSKQVIHIMGRAMEAFEMRAERLQERLSFEDVTFVKEQCNEILSLDRAQMRDRIEAGIILGSLYSASNEWVNASNAYEKTIILFKRLVTRSLSRADQEWLLKRFSTHLPTKASFAAFYVAKAVGSSVKEIAFFTLQHSESSRGIFASLVFQSMMNLDQFKSADEQVANEYENLRRQLLLLEAVRGMEWDQSLSSNDNSRMTNVIQRRAEIDKRLSALEGRLEATTEDFTADVLKRLIDTAAYVQVMGSSHGCIALLISGTDQRTIDLPQLKASETIKNLNRLYGKSRLSKIKSLEVPQAGQELREILKWLWDTAVKPILSKFGYYTKSKKPHSSQLSRLW